jgi:YesN/AraC family two-component response regulator
MMQDWKENVFNRSTFGDLQFYYSGIREKSMNHHYGPLMAKHYLLNFVCEGSADFWCQGVRQEIYPGTFYVMFPNEDMYYQTKKDMGWSIYWVVVDGYQVELLLSELGLTPDNPFLKIENAENLKELFNQIFELTKEDSFKNKMLCHSCLYQIFAILLEQKREIGHKNLIWEAERYISQHLSGTVTVNEIAAHVHLNGNYFTKLFKKTMGVTPLNYINQKRIEKGKYLLEHTQFSVGEISEEVGFKDELYFSRVFKKYVGISPLAYRKQVLTHIL